MGQIRVMSLNGRGTKNFPQANTDTLEEFFRNYDAILNTIPKEKHTNLYYTIAQCQEGKNRTLVRQTAIQFDIDGCEEPLEKAHIDKYIAIFDQFLGVERSNYPIIMSGHGLQMIVPMTEQHYIHNSKYFDEFRSYYGWVADQLNHNFELNGLTGKADKAVWSKGRLMRMPNTINDKSSKGLPPVDTYFIENGWREYDFDLVVKSRFLQVDPSDMYHDNVLARSYGKPDGKAVLAGCDFLKYCKDNPNDISEPQWYAMLGVLARLEKGKDLCHEYSGGYASYTQWKTDLKIEQALARSGPRLCKSIHNMWPGCEDCAYNGKIKTPLQIKSEGHISSEHTGFHTEIINMAGVVTKRKPNYPDLVKYFGKQHEFFSCKLTEDIYIYNGSHWEGVPDTYLKEFATKHFNPSATVAMMKEFVGVIKSANYASTDLFFSSPNLVNFRNGTLDINSGKLSEHGADFYRTVTLPFDYNPQAICPRFDKFMDEILPDKDVQSLILEFFGYCLSGAPARIGQKALLLIGGGANGKSVLLSCLRSLAGNDAYTSISMGKNFENPFNLDLLKNKLFNISEETPATKSALGEQFKNLVSGGEALASKKGKTPYKLKNNAKLIICGNKLPAYLSDTSHGLMRRLLPVHFEKQFDRKSRDNGLETTLERETAGIFNRVYSAYKSWLKNREFTEPVMVAESIAQYREETDNVYSFATKMMLDKPDSFVTSMLLFERYREWCEVMGERQESMQGFIKRLKVLLPKMEAKTVKNSRGYVNYQLSKEVVYE